MRNIFTFCLFWTVFLFFSQNASACQCFENFTPLVFDYAKAESVFVGKVINTKKFGNEPEKEAYVPRYRTVEFEIQKIYKGINQTTQRVTLHTNFNAASCGFAKDEAPKKGQKWIVFVYKNQKENRLFFGGMCEPTNRLEKSTDLLEYENEILSIKDKQGIFGSVVDDMKIEGIKNIEVNLEGEGQNLTTRTGKNGAFYFPILLKGNYKITVNVPFPAMYSADSNYAVKQKSTRENADENSKILKSTLTYEVQLKEGEFDYNEIKLFVFEPKVQTNK